MRWGSIRWSQYRPNFLLNVGSTVGLQYSKKTGKWETDWAFVVLARNQRPELSRVVFITLLEAASRRLPALEK